MANVPTQLSPGVNITEIDLSGIVREGGNNIAGFVGQFRWGPASESLLVDNERRLNDIFLNPTNVLPEKAQDDFFSAVNFLRYSDKLKIVRVVSENARNARGGQANSTVGNPILIHNDEEFFYLSDPNGSGVRNYSNVLSDANWIARYPGDVGNSIEVRAIGAGTFVAGSVDTTEGGGGGGSICEETSCPSGQRFDFDVCGCVDIVCPEENCSPGFEWSFSGCTCEEIPPQTGSFNFSLPLIINGEPAEGVTYAVVTVAQLSEVFSYPNALAPFNGQTWANRFVHNGSTGAGGNTFGVNYLCFFLRGSSYCNNPGSFPIPGGSYGNIPGSNATGGLTYSAFYRDTFFYGTFGTGTNQTFGGDWTDNGPLLAARTAIGITFNDGSATWHRGQVFGKGFHQVSQTGNHGTVKGVISKGIVQNLDFGNYEGPIEAPDTITQYGTYPKTSPMLSLSQAAVVLPSGYWFTSNFFRGPDSKLAQNPWCLEFDPTLLVSDADDLRNNLNNNPFREKPFTSVSNINFISDGDGSNVQRFTFPNFMILPIDNAGITITEPYTNEFTQSKTYRESITINGIANAGLQIARDANTYRNMSTGRAILRGITGGATAANTDPANTPLRAVIDAFPGITAANVKGMLLLFAFSQQIDGMTTGLLSSWHVGLGATTSSTGINDTANISNVDGLDANGTTSGSATNVVPDHGGFPVIQVIYGFKTEHDVDQNITRDGSDPNFSPSSGLTACVYPTYGRTTNLPYASAEAVRGSQAIPFRIDEISLIRDFIFKKTESQ